MPNIVSPANNQLQVENADIGVEVAMELLMGFNTELFDFLDVLNGPSVEAVSMKKMQTSSSYSKMKDGNPDLSRFH